MSRNDITNDLIASGPDGTDAQDKYAKGWDAIFGNRQKAKDYLERTHDEFSKRLKAAKEERPECFIGGVMAGPVADAPKYSKAQQAILDDDEPCIMGGGCYGPSMSFNAWESQPKYKIEDILADPTHHAYKATLEVLELLERGEIDFS